MAALEAARAQFELLETTVLAINPASAKSHAGYCEKKGFGFPILSDPESKVTDAFHSVKENGKGVLRTVYALDRNGKVIFAQRGHADNSELMELIKSDQS